MTCQNLGVLCLQWSIVMASFFIGTLSADTKPRLVPPEIIEGPNIHEYFPDIHDQKRLPCLATGTPPIAYKWLFNGVEVRSEGPIQLRDGNLHFMNPTSQMEGYYQCRASNEAGIAISNMTFLQARVFESLPKRERQTIHSRSVEVYDNAVLPCNHIIRSLPPARIVWELSTDGGTDFREVQHDNHVTTAQNGSLVFSFVKKNDTAIYKCYAHNGKQGIAGSYVNLTIEAEDASVLEGKINEKPVPLYNSPDVTVLVGQELRLECIFGGWLVPKVEWTTPSGVTNVSHAWVIPSVTADDAGVYSCRARKMNDGNIFLYSQQVNISVQVDAIPTFVAPMSNQEVPDSGRDVTFTCQGRGKPSPTVTWYINGTSVEKLEDAVDHSISGDGPTSVLVLRNIRTSATVACNASNAHGYRLQSAIVIVGESEAEHIPTSSSQYVIITSPVTSADKQPSTKVTTIPHWNDKSSTTKYHSRTTVNPSKDKDKTNTNDSPAPHVEETSLSPTTKTIIIAAPVAFAVILLATIVFVIIFVRQRRRRGEFSLAEQGQPLRVELRVQNDRTYDSDDSGFDDVKAESERRALQGHLPPS